MQVNGILFDRQEKLKSMGFGKKSIFAPFSFQKVVEIEKKNATQIECM